MGTRIDGLLAAGEMVYRGVIDASANPNYPAARPGDVYTISVGGRIGGASGAMVLQFDTLIAKVATPGGTQAAVGADWNRNGDRKTPNQLTSGQATMDRSEAAVATSTMGISQRLNLAYFTAVQTFTSTQVKVFSSATAAGATPTLVRIGLYSIDATTGAGTLVASTVSDTALFATVNTAYTKSWSSSVGVVAGQRYALATLVVTAAAAPSHPGQIFFGSVGNQGGIEAGLAPRMSAFIAAQADLPGSFVAGSLADSSAKFYGVVLP